MSLASRDEERREGLGDFRLKNRLRGAKRRGFRASALKAGRPPLGSPYTTTPSQRNFARFGVKGGMGSGVRGGRPGRQNSRKSRFSPVL